MSGINKLLDTNRVIGLLKGKNAGGVSSHITT